MKTQTSTMATLLTVGWLAFGTLGCSRESNGNGGSIQPPPAITCNGTNCPTGSLPVGSQLGFYAQTDNFYLPGYTNVNSQLLLSGGYYDVMKTAMGVCDRGTMVGGYSGGLAACQTWMNGAHDLVLFSEKGSTADTVRLVFRSIPEVNTYGYSANWALDLPSFEAMIGQLLGFRVGNTARIYMSMVLEATINPVNNSKGFEVRAYGPRNSFARNRLFQFQVADGKLEDATLKFRLFFDSKLAAEGRMSRCQSQYCGMDASYYNVSF